VDERPARAEAARHDTFPDGSRLASVDIPNRRMRILDTGADQPREVSFSYQSNGVRIYCVIAGPDGKIYAGRFLILKNKKTLPNPPVIAISFGCESWND
jgi:hypothetical protein